MKYKVISLAISISCALVSANAQYNPHAGRIVSYTEHSAVTATSGLNPLLAIDNDTRTFWESAATIPEGYISRPDLNVMLKTFSGITNNAFDGNLNTAQRFEKADRHGLYTFAHTFDKTTAVRHIVLKAQVSSMLTVFLIRNGIKTVVLTYQPGENYSLKSHLPDPSQFYDAVAVQCDSPFDVFELAVMTEEPFEGIVFDFGKVVPIGQIYSRHMSSDHVYRSIIEFSADGFSWTKVAELHPQAIAFVPMILDREYEARFMRLLHFLKPVDYAKAVVWEVKVYDRNGPFGKPADFTINPANISDRLGINGIWGWGYNTYSDNLPEGAGPEFFAQVASSGRNYHEMLWDVTSPAETPDYAAMASGKGTKPYWWLNWDREYGTWRNTGFKVTATIMFTSKTVPEHLWPDPIEHARKYGYAFAKHFGPGKGNALVGMVEAGNEPWDYSKGFYPKVLQGMASGFKDADPQLRVIPAAFQATFMRYEGHDDNHYIADNIPKEAIPFLDGLNGHFYSHTFDHEGKGITVNPEDPRSGLHGIRNLLRWRDANMPGKPVYITEYGFDSEGGEEECDFAGCISEEKQAAWGLRALMILLRQGAESAYWYFFANEFTAAVLHSRSGLTASADKKFSPKASFHAFRKFNAILGKTRLMKVLAESDQLYAYYFEDVGGNAFVVVWAPHGDDPDKGLSVSMKLPGNPESYCYLDGHEKTEWNALKMNQDRNTYNIKGYPMIIRLSGK